MEVVGEGVAHLNVGEGVVGRWWERAWLTSMSVRVLV